MTDFAQVVAVRQKIKARRDKLRMEYEVQDTALEAEQLKLDNFLLAALNTMNTDSMATPHGTFYREQSIKPSCQDWDAFYSWVAANDAFDFLEKRLSRGAIKEYMEKHEGELPPGTACFREYVVRVRKARNSAAATAGDNEE